MGNVPMHVSNGKEWRISCENGHSPNGPFRVKAFYRRKESQVVFINGPLPLNCTLEVDNVTIVISGDNHQICIVGSNNKITVLGCNNVLRIEGPGNKLHTVGKGTVTYTNEPLLLSVTHGLQNKLLTNEAGQVVDGAPAKLPLTNERTDLSFVWGVRAMIRYSYSPLARGGDDGTNANGASGDADPTPKDPPSGGNDASGKRSQEDVKDDPESKRLKAE